MQEGWRYLPAFIFANFGGMIADNHIFFCSLLVV
jgi:hypothetical protein